MKKHNLIAFIPVEYDIKVIEKINDNYLKDEKYDEQNSLMDSFEEDYLNGKIEQEEWENIKNNSIADEIYSQPECYLFKQIRNAAKTDSFYSPIERKILKRGKLYYKLSEDYDYVYENIPNYYLLLTYYKSSQYDLAEIIVEVPDNETAYESIEKIFDIIAF